MRGGPAFLAAERVVHRIRVAPVLWAVLAAAAGSEAFEDSCQSKDTDTYIRAHAYTHLVIVRLVRARPRKINYHKIKALFVKALFDEGFIYEDCLSLLCKGFIS